MAKIHTRLRAVEVIDSETHTENVQVHTYSTCVIYTLLICKKIYFWNSASTKRGLGGKAGSGRNTPGAF